jgi:hypothetical protein
MPDWKTVQELWRYWHEMFVRAFWDSLLFFFDTKQDVWKGIGLILLGMGVTTFIVWIARDREALTEHLKSNVAIVIAGGISTWIIVLLCYFVAEPLMQHREDTGDLDIASRDARQAVINMQNATVQRDECRHGWEEEAKQHCGPSASAPKQLAQELRSLASDILSFEGMARTGMPVEIESTNPGAQLQVERSREEVANYISGKIIEFLREFGPRIESEKTKLRPYGLDVSHIEEHVTYMNSIPLTDQIARDLTSLASQLDQKSKN